MSNAIAAHRTSLRTTLAIPNRHAGLRRAPARLSLLSLALSGAFSAITPSQAMAADISVSTTQGGVTVGSALGYLSITSNGSIVSSNFGITNTAYIGTLDNQGGITATDIGIYLLSITGSIATLSNSGNIYGGQIGIDNVHGSIGTLDNQGSIGGVAAIYNNSSGAVISTLSNSGVIHGTSYGIFDLAGTIDTLHNSGLISSSQYGIYNASTSTIGTLNNQGTISGTLDGIYNTSTSTIGTLNNSGLISGSAYALYNTATMGVISNSGTIAGNIFSSSSNNLTINGGTTIAGTLTGSNGGVGTITNTVSNLVFDSGLLFLNDNINVGSHSVVNNASTLQVNNHLTISGSYSQGSSATLLIGVADTSDANGLASDTGYGYLYVTGNTTIASGSAITLTLTGSSYQFAQGQRYVVVITAGSATYNAGSLLYSATGYSGAVSGTVVSDSNGGTDLVLVLSDSSGSSSPVNAASAANATAALGGLFSYSGVNTTLLNLFNAAAALDSSTAANRAGAQLSPVANHAAVAQSSTASTDEVINQVSAHIDSLRLAQQSGVSGVASGESDNNPAFWGQLFGGKASQGQRDNISGYRANYKGILLGADTALNEHWRLGGLFSNAYTGVSDSGDNSGSSASAKSYGVMGYAGYSDDRYYLDLSAGAVLHRYDTERAISFSGFSGTALGQFNARQYVASARAGYPLRLDAWASGAILTPLAGLSYSSLHQNGYSESGGNGAALNVNATASSSLKSELGAKLEQTFDTRYGMLTPSIQLGWRHEFHNNPQQLVASYVEDSSGATSFTTQSASAIRDTGVVALGVTLAQSKNLTLTARYTLEGAAGFTAQTADVRLRYQF